MVRSVSVRLFLLVPFWSVLVISAGVSASSLQIRGEHVVYVNDFGGAPDSATDSAPAVRAAIAAVQSAGAPAVVEFGAGTYTLASGEGGLIGIINNGADLCLRGVAGQTRLLITDPRLGAFIFAACTNCWLENLSIDYDPVPFTQGVITGLAPEVNGFTVTLDPGYPSLSEPWFAEAPKPFGRWSILFDSETRLMKTGVPDFIFIDEWSQAGPNEFTLQVSEGQEYKLPSVEPGDRFVHLARGIGGNALFWWKCKGGGCRRVLVHASTGLAVGLVGCSDITIDALVVRPPDGTDRLISTDADGVHVQQNRTGPLIENCHFENLADDAINIYCPVSLLREVHSDSEVTVSADCEIRLMDLMQVFNPRSAELLGLVRVQKVEPGQGTFRLWFDQAVPGMTSGSDSRTADTLFNVSASGAGAVIRNCTMKNLRRYGVYMKASRTRIEGNTFTGLGGSGILIANSPAWPEGPVPQDVVVTGNTIIGGMRSAPYGERVFGAAIEVYGATLGDIPGAGRPVQRVEVRDNHFINPPGAAIYVGSLETAAVIGNSVVAATTAESHRLTASVILDNCSGVEVDALTVDDPRTTTTAALEIRSLVTPGSAGVVVGSITATLAEGAETVIDRR